MQHARPSGARGQRALSGFELELEAHRIGVWAVS